MNARAFRVGTWNVHGLRGGVREVASVVRAEELDVLLVQESGSRQAFEELRRRLAWVACRDRRAFRLRRVQNAVLLRPDVVGSVRWRTVRFAGASPLQPRGVTVAEIDGRWTAASVHLGLAGPERGRHVRQLLSLAEGWGPRCVIGADLNAAPTDPGPAAIAERFTDVWTVAGEGGGVTFPAKAPAARIDALFVGSAVRALRARTSGGAVSDHLMVVADLAFED